MYWRWTPFTVVVYVPLLSVGDLPHPWERPVEAAEELVVVDVVVVVTRVVVVVLGMQFPGKHWE
jgi:hypothetical protein